jgi:glucan biosynthesis protein C
MTPKHRALSRRYELDWLRVLAILAVFIYHGLRFFDREDWHLKNAILYPVLDPLMKLFSLWGMPLLFTISGAAVFYSLGRRSAGKFLKSRSVRLLVPLGIGIFTHGMWQVYLEKSSHGLFAGSFLQFIPRYFDGLYGLGGNFAWMGLHLWYLEVLFVFSLATLPILEWLRKGKGKSFFLSLGNALAIPGGIYFLAIPVILLSLLDPGTILTARAFGGWSIAAYLLFFLNGFLVVSNDRLYQSIQMTRWISLGTGLTVTSLMSAAYFRLGEPTFGTAYYTALISAFGLCSWLWVLTILGFAARHLRFSNRFLTYSNEAVLPFYILHQPLLLAFGTLFIPASLPDVIKWTLISTAAFVSSASLHEIFIRRTSWIRFLFGLSIARPKAAALISNVTFPTRSSCLEKSPLEARNCGSILAGLPKETQPLRIESLKHSF